MTDIPHFEKTKVDAEMFYHTIGEVPCPYLQESVAFNAKGLKHIKFKKEAVARSHEDQYMRLKQIHLAPRVIAQSRTLQEYKETTCFEEQKSRGKRILALQQVTYYGFVAILREPHGMKRIKVVVKKVAGGKPYFWSIIPFWKSSSGNSRIMHAGSPELD